MDHSEWKKEHAKIIEEEKSFLKQREREVSSFVNEMVEEVVPEKFCEKLNTAFVKGFELIFQKGLPIVEKTYSRQKYREDYNINRFIMNQRKKGGINGFKDTAEKAGRKNLLLSGAEGVGLGVLGVGIPDIPIFIGMIMKSVQEIALSYGFEYQSESEKIFILRLIRTAISRGDEFKNGNILLGKMICDYQMEKTTEKEEIALTAKALSDRLLYMKFVQGIPIVGIVGGISDVTVMKEVSEYARLIYKKRFLRKIWLAGKDML